MKKTPSVLVCVTTQKTCERLILEGVKIAKPLRADLYLVHVAKTGQYFLGSEYEGPALDHLFHISKEYGADMMVLRSDNVAEALASHAKSCGATHMVFGKSPEPPGPRNIITRVEQLLKNADVQIRIV